MTVVDKQEKSLYHNTIHLFSFNEISILLEAAGFRIVTVFGCFSSEKFDLNHDRMLVLARTAKGEDS